MEALIEICCACDKLEQFEFLVSTKLLRLEKVELYRGIV